jgi:hypothetical protein
MGFIGKLLVVLHATVSLGVFAWAGGVFTHRIDWNTPKVEPGKESAPGLFDRQKALVDQKNIAIDKAYTRWSGNLSQVQVLERERYPRRDFYVGQLELVRTGEYPRGTPQRDPVQELVYAPNGYLDITRPTGRPAFMVRPMVPGDSIIGYDRKMTKILEDVQASQVRNAAAIVDREKLNREIVGVTQPAVIKGLRTLLNEQKTIEDRANTEDTYVTGFVTNREAEFGLLKKRRDAMLARMDELKPRR